jgi:hypothetical protein
VPTKPAPRPATPFGRSRIHRRPSPSADDDADGQSNALEYAFLTDPKKSNANNPLVFTYSASGCSLQFSYRPEATDLRYIVQRSSDLTIWTSIADIQLTSAGVATQASVPIVLNSSSKQVSITDTNVTTSRAFWRIVAQLN